MHRTLLSSFAQVIVLAAMVLAGPTGRASEPSTPEVLFRDVRVFDGRSATLSGPTTVLVR